VGSIVAEPFRLLERGSQTAAFPLEAWFPRRKSGSNVQEVHMSIQITGSYVGNKRIEIKHGPTGSMIITGHHFFAYGSRSSRFGLLYAYGDVNRCRTGWD